MSLKVMRGKEDYRIYYEDTDFTGYVYHANYLKFFERAREELIGIDYIRALFDQGLHFVVGRMNLMFHHPARHGDIIQVISEMPVCRGPVVPVCQTAYLTKGFDERVKLVTAEIKLVAVNDEGRSSRLPPDVMAYFASVADR